MVGQVMVDLGTRVLESYELRLNIQDLNEGIYFIHVMDAEGNAYISKFVKAE